MSEDQKKVVAFPGMAAMQMFLADAPGEKKEVFTVQKIEKSRDFSDPNAVYEIGAPMENPPTEASGSLNFEEEPTLDHAQLAAGIDMLDSMNREVLKDDPFVSFLYRLNMANLRSGRPVPRSILLQEGITKQGLKKLVQEGYLKEHRTNLRNAGAGRKGTEVIGYTLAENVTFASE